VNQPTLSHLIALGEGFTTEFKRSMPSDLGREIYAFANATGGVILLRVDDARTVISVRDHNRLKSRVQSVARSADPPVAVEVESQGSVLCVTVPKQHDQRTNLHLPRQGRARDAGGTSRWNARRRFGQKERPPEPVALQYTLPHEVGRADR